MKSPVRRTKKALRLMAEPFVVAVPTGMRIRTRLRVNEDEAAVLMASGTHLGHLASKDVAARCGLGNGPKHLGRGPRKQALTAQSSSRWAGTITRISDDQRQMGADNLYRQREQLYDSAEAITRRLKVEVGVSVKDAQGHSTKGYGSKAERWMKQQRLQILTAKLEAVEKRIETGHVSVVRGGKDLMKKRHNLAAAGLTEPQWCETWDAARLFLSADGEADKMWGNENIRLNPDNGHLRPRLPTPLAHLSNPEGPTPIYVFESPVTFSYHADEWAGQAMSGAVSYTISFEPLKNRWYLDAAWSIAAVATPSLASLGAANTLGVDLNADHLAGWVLSPDGNPLGAPIRIDVGQQGSTETRDGHLRSAITTLLDLAQVHSCQSITIENLKIGRA